MKRIVFLDRGTISAEVDIPRPAFAHDWRAYDRSAPSDVVERLRGAQFAITNKVPIQALYMRELPELELIAVIATGVNIVDLEAAHRHGISVCNAPGYAETSVAEHTLALILSLRRNLFEYREQVLAGDWQASGQFCFHNRAILELKDSVLGLIGTGAIAQSVAARARAFGMEVLFHSPSGREGCDSVSLESLLRESDIVSCHTPLSARTHDLIGEEELGLMKSSAIIINTARGEIIDLDVLSEFIEKGQIAGAGIDVAPVEPPPLDSALMRMSSLPNVIVTPHVGFAGSESQRRLCQMTIANIEAFVQGQPINLV